MLASSNHRTWTFVPGLLAAALVASLSGCAACCAPYDCDFPYTGGAWVRDNPSWGRVGSAFEPAGYKAVADDATPSEEPTPAQDPDADDPVPMPMNEGYAPPDESAPPRRETSPDMISTPRLRAVRNYLPQN